MPHCSLNLDFSSNLSVLSIFSCASWLRLLLLWRDVHVSSQFYIWFFVFWILSSVISLCISDIHSCSFASFCKYFLPFFFTCELESSYFYDLVLVSVQGSMNHLWVYVDPSLEPASHPHHPTLPGIHQAASEPRGVWQFESSHCFCSR